MGFALAQRAAEQGAEVTVVAANVSLPAPPGVRVVQVGTAAELADACAEAFEICDVVLMAAAVADFRPSAPAAHKLKKDEGVPRIELEPTEDVLSGLSAARRPGQVIVGFAAEHGPEALARGRAKLVRKRLDAVVINDISDPGIGFDSAENEVTVVTASRARASSGQSAQASGRRRDNRPGVDAAGSSSAWKGQGERSSSRPSRPR